MLWCVMKFKFLSILNASAGGYALYSALALCVLKLSKTTRIFFASGNPHQLIPSYSVQNRQRFYSQSPSLFSTLGVGVCLET